MARTKNTAKKTTGAPAPRLALGGLRVQSVMATRHSMRIARPTAKTMGGGGEIVRGGNNFCSGCRNGGVLTMCSRSKCPRGFCGDCVIVDPTQVGQVDFTCPHCHVFSGENGRRAKKPSPYPFTVVGGASQRELYPICNEKSLVILSIRLSSIPADGLPPAIAYHHLYSYLPGAIALYDLPFDFSTKKGLKAYQLLIDQIVNDLTVGRLASSSRFAVYITDHTDPERGDLHFAPNGLGATQVGDLVNVLLPKTLTDIIRECCSGDNTLTFLACGALVNKEDSRKELRTLSTSGLFSWVMAFGQVDFQPYLCNLFLANVALRWFIQGRAPNTVVYEHQDVGAHTDVYMFCSDAVAYKMVWSHPGLRPFGQPSPTQCASCKSLKSWAKPMRTLEAGEDVQYSLRCRYCQEHLDYVKDDGMEMIKVSQNAPTERGYWYMQII